MKIWIAIAILTVVQIATAIVLIDFLAHQQACPQYERESTRAVTPLRT